MGSFKRFSEDKLPDRCKFYSSLKDECISEKDYLHIINVWNMFKMNTTVDYRDLCLKIDVLLLADVFEMINMFRTLWIRSLSLFY